ncbi:MAG: YihY/virulence factor BrkB family protein [Gemmatimonadetes bacterium]|nr:YihY/virulence factor BrkB family protein [Gemmatimonadota bacterium]
MAAARSNFELVKHSFSEFIDDECPRMAAALSYYMIFSLPSLLILILLIVGAIFDPEDVRGALQSQIESLMGPGGAQEVEAMLEHAQRPDMGAPLAALLGIGALLFGATGAFAELQAALNRAWEVKPDPEKGGLKNFILKRVFSFGMVLAIAFLLLVSLALSAALSAFGDAVGTMVPGGVSDILLHAINLLISLGVFTLLFASMFKVLPDAVIAWRDVWVGAFVTALLFVIGKFLIGLYLGQSDPGQAYGAAGSLVLMLVWIYYSAMILLLGAEFTQAWAESRGHGIEPEAGAVRLEPETPPAREPQAQSS